MIAPSSTVTISVRQRLDVVDLGSSNSDDEFVVIDCPKKPDNSTSDMVLVGSCEPQVTSRDNPAAESDVGLVVDTNKTY